ncbi:MAG: CpaF family protein [Chloroflexota bacterium]|nr:CpaF family protein [Chloroflexota bacterium]
MSILRSPAGRTRTEPEPIRPSANKPQATMMPLGERWTPEVLKISRLRDEAESQLVTRIHARLAASIGRSIDTASSESVRALINDQFPAALDEEKVSLSRTDRLRLQDAVLSEVIGYGPIQDVLADDNVSEVMVNGAKQVWVEREGKLHLTDITFSDDDHVLRVIQRIVAPLGRRCDESSPMVDARLPDGSRVNAIIPPLSLIGPTLTIRKFRKVPYGPMELLKNGTLTSEALQFLAASVKGRMNVVVAGGSGAGKTTFLNTLSNFISERERIVTIEDAAELQLQQLHVLTLESRPPNAEGRGEVAIRDLFRNALRMRPDRVIIGECRGPEALDMLQAMNTGHDGSLTTIHANGPRDALSRIETMVLMGGADLPLRAIREQIVAAIDLVVFVERMQDGARKVTQVSEVRGLEGDVITMQDIFAFDTRTAADRMRTDLRPTGIRPALTERLAARGIQLPSAWFGYAEPSEIGA